MTVDERFEQLERKTQRLEKRNKRLTVALTMTVVAMAAVVTMAATGDKDGHFDSITAKSIVVEDGMVASAIFVMNDAGDPVVSLGTKEDGSGVVYAESAKGKTLVVLGSTENGGAVQVSNKSGEIIANMYADEYGNGVVGAWDRKGKGRTLQPGP